MDIIDWIEKELQQKDKTRVGLGRAVCNDRTAGTKILKRMREIKISELPAIASYLEKEIPQNILFSHKSRTPFQVNKAKQVLLAEPPPSASPKAISKTTQALAKTLIKLAIKEKEAEGDNHGITEPQVKEAIRRLAGSLHGYEIQGVEMPQEELECLAYFTLSTLIKN